MNPPMRRLRRLLIFAMTLGLLAASPSARP